METEQMIARKASEKDIDILYEMIKGLATYEKRPEDVTGSIDKLKYWLFKKKIATALIAEFNRKPIGYAIYYPTFASFAANVNVHLEDFFIKKEYRGQGFGRQFFYMLCEIIEGEGYSKLEWSCLDWNAPSIGFYEKLGAIQEKGRFYFEYKIKNKDSNDVI